MEVDQEQQIYESTGVQDFSTSDEVAQQSTSSIKISKSPRMRGPRKRRDIDPLTGLVTSTKRMKIAELGLEEKNYEDVLDPSSRLVEEFDENLLYSDSDDGSADAHEYESDSNDENYYKNDYPDEDDLPCTLNLENESTSDEDDFFDHYGSNSKETRYSDYCYELSDVNEQN